MLERDGRYANEYASEWIGDEQTSDQLRLSRSDLAGFERFEKGAPFVRWRWLGFDRPRHGSKRLLTLIWSTEAPSESARALKKPSMGEGRRRRADTWGVPCVTT